MNTKLVRNYAVFFTGTGLSAIAGLAASIIYNWTFQPELLGRYSLVNTTYLVMYAFLCGWLASSFFRYYLSYKSEERESELFNVIFTVLALLNLAVLLLLFVLWRFVATGDFAMMIFVFAFNILPRCLVDLFVSKYKLDNTMKGYFIITVINSFGTLAVSLLLIFAAGLGIFSLILAPVIINALVLAALATKYRSFFRFRFRSGSGILKDFWSYGGPLIITGLINVGLALSDRYIIKYFFSDREVGIYANAYDLSEKFFRIFVNVFILTIQTYLMQVWHENRDSYGKTVKTVTRYYYIAFIPLIFIVDVILDFLFNRILNPEYIEGKSFTLAILAAIFFDGLVSISNRGFAVNKKTSHLRNAAFIAVTANLTLNFTLMPLLGYATAAYTTFAAYFLYVVAIYVLSVRKINWKWEFYDKVIFISGGYWTAGYIIIRLVPVYELKLLLLAVFCALYLFVLPGDVKELLKGYKNGLMELLNGRKVTR